MAVEYREWQPPGFLQDRVRCAWRLTDAEPDAAAQTIYPDGCCELILHLRAPMQRWQDAAGWQPQAACLYAAQQTRAIRLRAAGALDCIGLRLQPWASAQCCGPGLSALRDEIVDLKAMAPAIADTLGEWLPHLADEANAAWQALDRALGPCTAPPVLRQAVALQAEAGGRLRVDALARACALSARTLQAQFPRWVGLSAKEYARMLRLQATLRALDGGAEDLAGVSLDCGYSDQAHATREVRRLTELTPARLLRALQADRDGDGAIALAAVFVRGRGRALTARA